MKVVCIDGSWSLDPTQQSWGIVLPQQDKIYHVRSIEEIGGSLYYRFHEIHNKPVIAWSGTYAGQGTFGPFEAQFTATAFRRLTDISALEKLTTITTKTKELEEV